MNLRTATELILFPLLLLIAAGCVSTPVNPPPSGPVDSSPRTSLKHLRSLLENENWKYVYLLMSRRSRSCYSRSKIKTFLTRTKPGILEQYRLRFWKVDRVTYNDSNTSATMHLRHPHRSEYTMTYRFVLEDDVWRLDWSLADVLNVPRSVEDCNKNAPD